MDAIIIRNSVKHITSQFRHFSTFPISSPKIRTGNVWDSFACAVGNTSLIKLNGPSKLTGCNIYGKAEYENPGGSVKDRAARFIITKAEEEGRLTPGKPGIIIEGTAGNTGIGLTLMGNSRGYRTVISIAENQSIEKKNTLRHAGADLIEVPPVPFSNPNHFVHVAEKLAEAMGDKCFYADQWDNMANRQAHIETTGPEIFSQLDGKIDAFSCAMGTGGTLTGVGEYLRSQNSSIKICLTDPCGAALYRYYTEGELASEGTSISEGIGQGRVTGNMEGFQPDECYEIPDEEALPILYDLLEHEGLCLGSSTAINVAGAIRVAQDLGPGHTVVTMLCDAGTRYASRIYNPEFLKERSLPIPSWLNDRSDIPDLKHTVQEILKSE